jgi:hypothetical protein
MALVRAFATGRHRRTLSDFAAEVCRDERGHRIALAPIHTSWHDFVRRAWEAKQRALILAPFGHGKSQSLVIPLIAYELGRDPQLRVKIVSDSDDNAGQKLISLKRMIESPSYRRLFPGVRPGGTWTKTALYLQRHGHASDPSVESLSVEGKPLGKRADILVLDDVIDQEAEFSEPIRDKVYSRLTFSFFSRLAPGGRVLAVGTPQHADDSYARFSGSPGWRTLVQRISEDCSVIHQHETDESAPGVEVAGADLPLWGARWDQAALMKKASDDPREFARGFRMQAYSDDELSFPSFKDCIEPSALASDWWRRRMPAYVGVDISAGTRTGMSVVVLGFDQRSGRKFFLETASLSGGLDNLHAHLDGVTHRHDVRFIMVEDNGVQSVLTEHLEKFGNPAWKFLVEGVTTTSKNKRDRALGVKAMDAQFARRAFSFPGGEVANHPVGCRCAWDTLRRELESYPKGSCDDTVMATWFAEQAVHKWGAPVPLWENLVGLNDR